MENIMQFFYQSHPVRSVLIDGEPWFVAKDVCDVLEIGNPTDALKRLEDDERSLVSIEGASNGLPVNAINESGLYALVLGSRKPEAKAFKRWITHDVIPSIRKNGAYFPMEQVEEFLFSADTIIKMATEWKFEKEKRIELEAKVLADQPKVLFADAVSTSQDTILIRELAKILKQNGVDIGEKRLYQELRDRGYLIKQGSDRNTPTQRSMELKLFELKETPIFHSDGVVKLHATTKVTGKGQQYFVNLFRRELVAQEN